MATILVVEQRPVNRRFLATLLRERGHSVLQAPDGQEALAITRAENPDVVIIEILTPTIDAGQFAAGLVAGSAKPLPRLVFRAPEYIEAEGRAIANAFGAHFLVRPANPEGLLAVVGAALDGPAKGPEAGASQSAEDYLRALAGKLQSHADNMDRLNAQLDRRLAERDARLEIVRAALDQEIKKRLWAEQELTQSNVRLKDQVMHDGLTGLHNRRYLEESLGREESRARRSGRCGVAGNGPVSSSRRARRGPRLPLRRRGVRVGDVPDSSQYRPAARGEPPTGNSGARHRIRGQARRPDHGVGWDRDLPRSRRQCGSRAARCGRGSLPGKATWAEPGRSWRLQGRRLIASRRAFGAAGGEGTLAETAPRVAKPRRRVADTRCRAHARHCRTPNGPRNVARV